LGDERDEGCDPNEGSGDNSCFGGGNMQQKSEGPILGQSKNTLFILEGYYFP
jgi:hypothetical protein